MGGTFEDHFKDQTFDLSKVRFRKTETKVIKVTLHSDSCPNDKVHTVNQCKAAGGKEILFRFSTSKKATQWKIFFQKLIDNDKDPDLVEGIPSEWWKELENKTSGRRRMAVMARLDRLDRNPP